MKSHRLPNAAQLNHDPAAARANATRGTRLRATAFAALTLLCLVGLSFAVTASSAKVGKRQRKRATPPPAAAPARPPAPAATTITTTTTTTTTTTPTPPPQPPQTDPPPPPPPVSGERVKLYYLREGTKIAAALNAIAAVKDSSIAGLAVGVIAEDEVVLIGTDARRKFAKRLISTLDLPRPGVQMEMWGLQISSREPDDMAEVMRLARAEIDKTQQAVRDAYAALQEYARLIPDDRLDGRFKLILKDHLYYTSALSPHRQLSLSDILLRLIAAEDTLAETRWVANELDKWLEDRHADYLNAAVKADVKRPKSKSGKKEPAPPTPCDQRTTPFGRFFGSRGLTYKCENARGSRWEIDQGPAAAENVKIGKGALLNFALHYGRLIHDPDKFDPYYLQQSAGTLNARLQTSIDALNLDVRDLFVSPTLDRIRGIVAGFKDVEYAQVGRTTVSSLSGTPTIVSSRAVNTFETTRPLSLTDFLGSAKTIMDSTAPFVPDATKTNKLGTLPFAEVVGLVGALGQDRSVWRELNSGVSFTITPSVLRNMSSAELQVALETGDPVASGTQQNGPGVRPLTRVSQHNVTTKVYVNALDFFDLSAFASQATLTGGRGYVPIIGPFWRGLFGDAPVIGELLSWKKPPKTVYSQSLVLTTSFITPTAMGVALLLPTDSPDEVDAKVYQTCFKQIRDEIDRYDEYLFDKSAKLAAADKGRDEAKQCVERVKSAMEASQAASGTK